MKISEFTAAISNANGLARTNRYIVNIPIPLVIKASKNRQDIEMMQLFCDQCQIPGLSVNTLQNRSFGEIREVPYEFNYDPVTFSFLVDSSMVIKGIMDDWIKSIQGGLSRTYNYYDDYICPELTITVQDLQDNNTYNVVLYEAYPKSVNTIQLDYSSKDIMRVSVSMMYKYWMSGIEERIEVPRNSPPSITQQSETNTVTNAVTEVVNPYIDENVGNSASDGGYHYYEDGRI